MKKFFALTAAATIAATSAFAAAPALIDAPMTYDALHSIKIDIVNAPADATLEVYSHHAGQTEGLIATQDLKAGIYTDLSFPTHIKHANDALVVLKVNGEVVAQELILRD